jgi:hypothetical protein
MAEKPDDIETRYKDLLLTLRIGLQEITRIMERQIYEVEEELECIKIERARAARNTRPPSRQRRKTASR